MKLQRLNVITHTDDEKKIQRLIADGYVIVEELQAPIEVAEEEQEKPKKATRKTND